MEENKFIEQLQKLVETEDILSVGREVSELRGKFGDFILEEERKLQVAQLEAEEKGEKPEPVEADFGKDEFFAIYNEYQGKKKALIDERNASEASNLAEKKALIAQLQATVTSEENIGAAFNSFKEIQDKWKEIGDIPRNKRNDVQTEYSKLIEDFFYNINIYKELKEHDLHRNLQLKESIILKLKTISKIEKIKEVEVELKTIQNEWEDIGPVPNDDWEKMKDAYWTEVRSIYERINRFYDDRRTELSENIEKKKVVLAELESFMEGLDSIEGLKAWNTNTDKVIQFQKNYKAIGFGPKKENEKIWKAFRAQCDIFFAKKKEFFDGLHGEYDALAEKKKQLITKAEELKDSTDWKNTADKIKRLQSDWKRIGHAGVKHEQKLWKKFRGACDHFFSSREAHFKEQDKAFEENYTSKLALIEEMKKYAPSDDKEVALEGLKSFSEQFAAIGNVPMKNKDEIYKAYKSALDEIYSKLKLDDKEKEKILFKAKIDSMKTGPNSSKLLSSAKFDLRKKIDFHKKEINQLENNLGFFAQSKGAESLRNDVEKKVAALQAKIDDLIMKIKMIPNE